MFQCAGCNTLRLPVLPLPGRLQGNYSELMVKLSAIFSQLRGDQLAEAQGGSAQVRAAARAAPRGCGCRFCCTLLH